MNENILKTLLTIITAVILSTAANGTNIFMAGDSTMCCYDPQKTPQTGWGQILPEFCAEKVNVINMAKAGSSAKSYYLEKRWDELLRQVKAGDYIIIQFGHNDSKPGEKRFAAPAGEYKVIIKQFIQDAKAKSATPVLVTSIVRRTFDKDSRLQDTAKLREYADSMVAVGKECDVTVVDLNTLTQQMVSKMGEVESRKLYMVSVNQKDNVHITRNGAILFTQMFIQAVQTQKTPMAGLFKPTQP